MTSEQQNPLAVDKISSLILRFSVPSIIAMLVSAVYNIADQLFIGNAVGTLGNAATNIAFPLAMMCTGLGLLFGIGGNILHHRILLLITLHSPPHIIVYLSLIHI
mgnify:CR=1 FL=1